ncbi:MAG: hypothetical protein ACKVP7_21050 [Hyphomicrobiaceae bacterium]
MADGNTEQPTVSSTVQDPTHALLAVAVGAVAAMVWAVMKGYGGLAIVPAGLFVCIAIWAAVLANRNDWHAQSSDSMGPLPVQNRCLLALGRNSRIMGAAYAFSAFAMQLLYATPLTGLRWQHGWQYATAFALLAVLAFEYGRLVQTAAATTRAWLASLAVPLLIGQTVFAGTSLAFLTLSGKVFTRRPDWAANMVFLFATLMVMMLGGIALRTHAVLSER